MTHSPFLFTPLRQALVLGLCCVLPPAWAQSSGAMLGIADQAQGLPREFEAHFFDVPLAVRIDLDSRYLGDAMVVLTRDGRVQLLEFTDTQESREPAQVRARWQERLADGWALGQCSGKCPDGLRAVHYSLVNSQLSLLTDNAEESTDQQRYYSLPDGGSTGLLLRNQLNLVRNGTETTGRYDLQAQGSLGNWTTLADANFDRGSDQPSGVNHRLGQLYAERLFEDHFFRLGYFTPTAQGLTRQPRVLGSSSDTALGVMFGSSDTLQVNNGQPSTTPIYVTPNRPGVVEIYRNGVLINSQPVQPGLQTLDTRVLPGGIYEVEVRLIEDGQETSRSEAFVYKPSGWSNPDSRWRYNLYAGQQTTLLSNVESPHQDSFSAGAMANYLLHPRAVLGLSAQQVDDTMQYGTSLDWDVLDRVKVYGSVFTTDGYGSGYDAQIVSNQESGSLVLSHGKTWIDTVSARDYQRREEVSQSSVSWSHRVNRHSSANMRLSQSSGAADGVGIDLGWSYYGKLAGSDANWRLTVFDRPGTTSSGGARNRGASLSLSMNLGKPGQSIAASLGSRTSRDGQRDHNASLSYQQDVDLGAVRSLGGSLSVDRYGAGFGGNAAFQNQSLYGDAYAMTSSYNGELTAGLNLQNTVAIGGSRVAASGEFQSYEAGLIVDVDSDIESLQLRAEDSQGKSSTLRPGRNVVPVGAFKSGSVQFDFEGDGDTAAVIQPGSVDYHLNRGGVGHRTLRVLRTVTVLGRVVDQQGQPMAGVQLVNHASRSVSEAGGHFTVEMSQSTPTLEVRKGGESMCLLTLDLERIERDSDVVFAGDLSCAPKQWVQASASTKENKS